MQTLLVKVPGRIENSAQKFEQLLTQLHETIQGQAIAFELFVVGQNIHVSCTATSEVVNGFAGQIYAQFPESEVVEGPDFLETLADQKNLAGFEMKLKRNYLYPLTTYSEFDGDSLSGLLSVLSRLSSDECVVVQLIVKPIADSALRNLILAWDRRFERWGRVFQSRYWLKSGLAELYDKKVEQKSKSRLFYCSLRLALTSSDSETGVSGRAAAILGALASFNTVDLNGLKVLRRYTTLSALHIFKKRALFAPFILSKAEVASLFHLPSQEAVPNIVHVLSRRQAPPKDLPITGGAEISFFGSTNFRDRRVPFGTYLADRRRHMYVLGKSGSGKSKLLELLIKSDLENGRGIGVLDPHGDLIDHILQLIPRKRVNDVVLFDPSDTYFPPAFNPLGQVPDHLKIRVTLGFIDIFKKLFGTHWSARLEHVLRYTTLALLDTPNATVLSILKMLTDKSYRQMVVRNIQDNVVKNFWVNEFASWSERFDNEAITPLVNKVGQFVSTSTIRNVVGQPANLIDFRKIMDDGKILLMKVSKGTLGEENAALLGAMAVTKIYQAAMSRADVAESQRRDFFMYVDEFHNFATDSFGEILSEARKYGLNLTLANQFLGQLNEKMYKTVFGNIGTLLTFQAGAEDATILAKEFSPRFSAQDIINLPIRDFCVKMSIGGEAREAFSGRTLDLPLPTQHYRTQCIEQSRQKYARPLNEVEKILKDWQEGRYKEGDTEGQPDASGRENVKFKEPLI